MRFQFPPQSYNLVYNFLFILPLLLLSACISSVISTTPPPKTGPNNSYDALPDTTLSFTVKDSLNSEAKPILSLVDKKFLLEEQAQHWSGTPHRLGGTTRAGIDCSALVQSIFDNAFNTYLPRTTAEQANVGKRIARSELQAGDLVFYKINSRTRHVGIYLTDNTFLHASKSEGVAIASMDNAYWKRRFWMARRILPTNANENIEHNNPSTPNKVQVKW